MAGMRCKVTARDLIKFQRNLAKINKKHLRIFIEDAAKELANRLLALVIKRTPVGDYRIAYDYTLKGGKNKGQTVTRYRNPSGKLGGTLRCGWTSKTHEEAEKGSGKPGAKDIEEFLKTVDVKKSGDEYVIEIINPVEYAPYVEFGHRTPNGKGWVEGRFMLTISEMELQNMAPKILINKLEKFMKGASV